MVNRDLIRIKVVQLTYAYYQNGERNIDKAEKELLFSLSKAYGLYNYLLSLIVSITQEERRRVEILTNRAQREGTEVPSARFAYNKFAVQLEENKQLNLFIEGQKYRWEDDMEAVRKLCDQIEESTIYKEYMGSHRNTSVLLDKTLLYAFPECLCFQKHWDRNRRKVFVLSSLCIEDCG